MGNPTCRGIVQKVYFNKKSYRYAIVVPDKNGDDQWYSWGRKKPTRKSGEDLLEGDEVQFEYTVNGKYRNAEVETLKSRATEQSGKTKSTSQSRGSRGGGGKSAEEKNYWTQREEREARKDKQIAFQSAMNTATAMVSVMIDKEIVKIGGKAADKLDAFVAVVDTLAVDLFKRCQGIPDSYDSIIAGEEEDEDVAELPEDMDDGFGGDEDSFDDAEPEEEDDDEWD